MVPALKTSFRQWLLLAFLVIAALPTLTSVHALLLLERLAQQSRASASDAVLLTEDSQHLAEQTLAMERSARQYLILEDPVLRSRYHDAWQDAKHIQARLQGRLPLAARPLLQSWNGIASQQWQALAAQPPSSISPQALQAGFLQLRALAAQVGDAGKQVIQQQGDVLRQDLDEQRIALTGQVVASITFATLAAISFGLWLSRPLTHIEAAIGRLGDNQLQQRIEIRGPADLRRVGQQLDWLRQRLAELDADKARFLSHVSHELKTPLASLREGVALLEDGVAGPLSAQQREIVSILQANVSAQQQQIEDLLRFNTAVFAARRLQRSVIDLGTLISEVIKRQRLQWQVKQLQVTLSCPPLHWSVDADKLSTVLANLLANAIRFSPAGGRIHFQVQQQQQTLLIDCIDSGPGVATDDAPRIFEPFFQGRHQVGTTRQGNGIGLSIVREYIAAHGGHVQLLPNAPGAHFRIELPHAPA